MINNQPIDCLLIGYNDIDFAQFAAKQKEMEKYSGAYEEIKWNSVILHGKRVRYMDLFNHAISQATGQNPQYNVFKTPSLALCYLGSFLQKRQFKVDYINYFNHERQKFKELLAQSPRAIAITTTFYVDHEPIIEIVNFIREYNPTVKIIVGGPHIYNIGSDHDEETQEYIFDLLGADIYIIDSQGETTLSRVLRQLQNGQDLSQIPNLYYRLADGSFQTTARERENNNLDDNSVEWHYFANEFIVPMAYVRTARSCPFACAFCNYPEMAGAHVMSKIETVEKELQTLHAAGTRFLAFIDDTFNFPLERFKLLLKMMIRNQFQFRWVSFLRCSNVDEETLDLLQASGCLCVLLGIESGDQTILKYMKKAAKVEKYQWAIGELQKRGIITVASLICGFPGETEQSVKTTMNFIEASAPTFYSIQLYYHDTRAPIQQRAAEFNIQGAGLSWKHRSMDWKQAAEWSKYMFKNIKNSIPLSLYGVSAWGVGYLLSRGISVEQLKTCGQITKEMLIASFEDDFALDFSAQEQQLIDLFRHERN